MDGRAGALPSATPSAPSSKQGTVTYRHWLAICVLSLAACQPSGAQDPRPAPAPTEQDIASAYHPNYKIPAGTRSECLGRLVFEIPDKTTFEWGLPRQVWNNYSILGFSRILRGEQDMIHLANVAVVVAADATPKTIQEMQRITEVQKNIALHRFDEYIRRRLALADSQTALTNDSNYKNDPGQIAGLLKDAERLRKEAEVLKTDKLEFEKYWHPADWGLPDSTGYVAGPTLYAFILRGGYAFQFMSTGGEGEAPFEQRLAAFKDLLSRFEYRPLYQVPTQPGLCIPHGFIHDNGEGHFSAEVSYRFTDSPGVIYTLSTAVEGERNFNPAEPLLEATARATVAGLIGNSYGRKLKALGPKASSIGARAATLGGIYTTEGTPGYSLYAGARGWDHSHVLPFVSLNMRSFDRQTAPEDLKVDPPPFAQSMHRFDTTLGSLRTRKTP